MGYKVVADRYQMDMMRDCLELFDEDFDYFPDGVSDPDYVVTGCEPAEYSEEL